MDTISTYLTKDHRDCDEVFASLENAVADNNWDLTNTLFIDFHTDLNHHFSMEETIMFPAFEEKTGMTQGPTAMMRMEHDQMRSVLGQMKEDVDSKNKDHFFGLSESLMMLMQQHNMKEEQMLYAMADAHLGADVEGIVNNMKALDKN
ncbi:MAG: hemerythrin domain-containing protein [Campylobacteraceae bacterium]|nr:hemerythrin domain-containing protein [Campylobacteraceae bacterium]